MSNCCFYVLYMIIHRTRGTIFTNTIINKDNKYWYQYNFLMLSTLCDIEKIFVFPLIKILYNGSVLVGILRGLYPKKQLS